MSQQYTLNFQNKSSQTGSLCIFQTVPDANTSNIKTLAWYCQPAVPQQQVRLDWGIDYSFVWSQQGHLEPGDKFTAVQTLSANLNQKNQVDFKKQGDSYTFDNQTQGLHNGSLFIHQGNNVAIDKCVVGIGMSGRPAFIVESQPGFPLVFTPTPQYRIVFGSFQQREVLNVNNLNAYNLEFPEGSYKLSVTLNENGSFSISNQQL